MLLPSDNDSRNPGLLSGVCQLAVCSCVECLSSALRTKSPAQREDFSERWEGVVGFNEIQVSLADADVSLFPQGLQQQRPKGEPQRLSAKNGAVGLCGSSECTYSVALMQNLTLEDPCQSRESILRVAFHQTDEGHPNPGEERQLPGSLSRDALSLVRKFRNGLLKSGAVSCAPSVTQFWLVVPSSKDLSAKGDFSSHSVDAVVSEARGDSGKEEAEATRVEVRLGGKSAILFQPEVVARFLKCLRSPWSRETSQASSVEQKQELCPSSSAKLPLSNCPVKLVDSLRLRLSLQFEEVDILLVPQGHRQPLVRAQLGASRVDLLQRRFSLALAAFVSELKVRFVASIPERRQKLRPSHGSGDTASEKALLWGGCRALGLLPWQLASWVVLKVGRKKREMQALVLRINSRHPFVPDFNGCSTDVSADFGVARLVYVHPKVWCIFRLVMRDFIGVLSGEPVDACPPQEQNAVVWIRGFDSSLFSKSQRFIFPNAELEAFWRSSPSSPDEDASPSSDWRDCENRRLWLPSSGLRSVFAFAERAAALVSVSPSGGAKENAKDSLPSDACAKDGEEGVSKSDQRADSDFDSAGGEPSSAALPQALPFSRSLYKVRFSGPSEIRLPPSLGPFAVCAECSALLGSVLQKKGGGDRPGEETLSPASLKAFPCKCAFASRVECCVCDAQRCCGGLVKGLVFRLCGISVTNVWRLTPDLGLAEDIRVEFLDTTAFASQTEALDALLASPLFQTEREGFSWRGEREESLAAFKSIHFPHHVQSVLCSGKCREREARIRAADGAGVWGGEGLAGEAVLLGSSDLTLEFIRTPLAGPRPRTWMKVQAGRLPMYLTPAALQLVLDVLFRNVVASDSSVSNAEKIDAATAKEISTKCTAELIREALLEQLSLQSLLEKHLDFMALLQDFGIPQLLLEVQAEELAIAFFEPKRRAREGCFARLLKSLRRQRCAARSQSENSKEALKDASTDGPLSPSGRLDEEAVFLILHTSEFQVRDKVCREARGAVEDGLRPLSRVSASFALRCLLTADPVPNPRLSGEGFSVAGSGRTSSCAGKLGWRSWLCLRRRASAPFAVS